MKEISLEVEKQNIRPVRQVIDYIESNYDKPIKLSDVASEVHLNPVYLSNMFKKETGENFSDFLINYRMGLAKDMLQNTKMNINEIADSVGYSNARHFSKMFKKVVGIRPTEYRKIYG